MIKEYSQGIMFDGPVILKDGQPLTPKEIVKDLNLMTKALALVKEMHNANGFDLPRTYEIIIEALE